MTTCCVHFHFRTNNCSSTNLVALWQQTFNSLSLSLSNPCLITIKRYFVSQHSYLSTRETCSKRMHTRTHLIIRKERKRLQSGSLLSLEAPHRQEMQEMRQKKIHLLSGFRSTGFKFQFLLFFFFMLHQEF